MKKKNLILILIILVITLSFVYADTPTYNPEGILNEGKQPTVEQPQAPTIEQPAEDVFDDYDLATIEKVYYEKKYGCYYISTAADSEGKHWVLPIANMKVETKPNTIFLNNFLKGKQVEIYYEYDTIKDIYTVYYFTIQMLL